MAGFRFVQIGRAVGRGGVNAYVDVVAIQELLNAYMAGSAKLLAVTGTAAP